MYNWHTVTLKERWADVFYIQFTQMQSILILSSFVYSCPFLAFLSSSIALSRYFDIFVISVTI